MNAARQRVVTLIFLIVFLFSPVVASDVPRFLSFLEGTWTGQAEITPIGPRPYDMRFEKTQDGRIMGSANPGAATHHWTFYEEEGKLHLRFLTTFAGNTEPVFLDAREWGEHGVLFRADKLPILSVRVAPREDRLMMDVYHWDELHVSIRLNRH